MGIWSPGTHPVEFEYEYDELNDAFICSSCRWLDTNTLDPNPQAIFDVVWFEHRTRGAAIPLIVDMLPHEMSEPVIGEDNLPTGERLLLPEYEIIIDYGGVDGHIAITIPTVDQSIWDAIEAMLTTTFGGAVTLV